jgi:hypothetical protein
MPDDPKKKRRGRAKRKAEADLMDMGYCVVRSDNRKVCLVGFSSTDIRVVRIALDAPTPGDRIALQSIEVPGLCKRELWIRKSGFTDFEKHKI